MRLPARIHGRAGSAGARSTARSRGFVLRCLALLAFLAPAAALAQAHCDPRVLGPDDSAEVREKYASRIVGPSDIHRQLVRRAFELAPDLLCHAVQRVVFVEDAGDSGMTMGWTYANPGDLIYISALPSTASFRNLLPEYLARAYASLGEEAIEGLAAKNQAEVIQSILHEAGHAAHHLLDSQRNTSVFGSAPDADAWDAAAVAFAKQVVEVHRLGAGMLDGEWKRLHEAFAAMGMARPWGAGPGNQLAGGFMSDYAATKASDDIAEATAWALAAPLYEGLAQGDPEDKACQAMKAAGKDDLGGGNAAFYVKLAFLEDLGFITREAFDRCVGPVRFDTEGSEGFHVYDGSQLRRSIGNGVAAVIGMDRAHDRYVFTLDAEGEGRFSDETIGLHFALKLKLVDGYLQSKITDIKDVSWPRGIYTLVRPDEPSSFWIDAKDHPAATLWATKGMVLVIRASRERIEGSIVPQMFLRPFAPIPVPQVPPSRITFVLKN